MFINIQQQQQLSSPIHQQALSLHQFINMFQNIINNNSHEIIQIQQTTTSLFINFFTKTQRTNIYDFWTYEFIINNN